MGQIGAKSAIGISAIWGFAGAFQQLPRSSSRWQRVPQASDVNPMGCLPPASRTMFGARSEIGHLLNAAFGCLLRIGNLSKALAPLSSAEQLLRFGVLRIEASSCPIGICEDKLGLNSALSDLEHVDTERIFVQRSTGVQNVGHLALVDLNC
jgi:hypothetical protein